MTHLNRCLERFANPFLAKVKLNGQEFDSRSKACDTYCKMREPLFRKVMLKDLESSM